MIELLRLTLQHSQTGGHVAVCTYIIYMYITVYMMIPRAYDGVPPPVDGSTPAKKRYFLRSKTIVKLFVVWPYFWASRSVFIWPYDKICFFMSETAKIVRLDVQCKNSFHSFPQLRRKFQTNVTHRASTSRGEFGSSWACFVGEWWVVSDLFYFIPFQ